MGCQVEVTINQTAPSSARYLLTIKNRGFTTLVNGSIDHSRALHPGNFGLDDTHMPADIWIQPPVQFERLAPSVTLSFEVEGYDIPVKFDMDRTQSVRFKCSIENGRGEEIVMSPSAVMQWVKPRPVRAFTSDSLRRAGFSLQREHWISLAVIVVLLVWVLVQGPNSS